LSGAVTGFQSFTVVGNGNTTYYSATDATGGWEVGIGTYATGGTLTRTTILSSSNSGSAVTFSGTVNVFLTYPSGKSVNLDASGNVSALGTVASGTWQGATLAIAYGGTNSTATPTAGGAGYGTGTAHAYTAAGTSGQALISAGGSAPAFGALAIGTANTNISGALTVTNGGTGLATLTANYVPYGNGTGAFQSSSNFTYNGSSLGVTSTGTATIFSTNLVGGDCFSFNCTGTTSSVYGISIYSSASAANTAYLFRGYNSLSTLAFSINGAGTILNGTWQATAIGTAYGGTGATSAQAGMNALAGAVTSGSYLRGNGTNVVMNTIQAADVPTLNQNTTGSSGSCTGNAAQVYGPNASQQNIYYDYYNTGYYIQPRATSNINSLQAATLYINGGTVGGDGAICNMSNAGAVQALYVAGTGGTAIVGYHNPNGRVGYVLTDGGSCSFVNASDYRLKENITPITGALDAIKNLNPVSWKWKAGDSNGKGFIAHEIQAILPECVDGVKDAVDANGKPLYQGVALSSLIVILTSAMQEQQALIVELQTQVAALNAKVGI
jgi:hypothetical protein